MNIDEIKNKTNIRVEIFVLFGFMRLLQETVQLNSYVTPLNILIFRSFAGVGVLRKTLGGGRQTAHSTAY